MFAGLFLLSEPLLLGESRSIKQDVLLLGCLCSAALVFERYLERGTAKRLVIAATLFGLAMATKAIATIILALTAVFLWRSVRERGGTSAEAARATALLLGVAFGALVVVGPNLWGNPPVGIYEMFSTALSSS